MLNNIWYGCQIRNSVGSVRAAPLHGASRTLVKKNPLTVKFTFKKEAKWSDGKPVVAEDFWADVAGLHQPEVQSHQPHRL